MLVEGRNTAFLSVVGFVQLGESLVENRGSFLETVNILVNLGQLPFDRKPLLNCVLGVFLEISHLSARFDVEHPGDRDFFLVIDQLPLLLLHRQLSIFLFLLQTFDFILDVFELLICIIFNKLKHLNILSVLKFILAEVLLVFVANRQVIFIWLMATCCVYTTIFK